MVLSQHTKKCEHQREKVIEEKRPIIKIVKGLKANLNTPCASCFTKSLTLAFFHPFPEIARVQSGRSSANGGNYREPIKYVDVYRERPIRLTVRVLVPVREHPKVS